MALARMRTIHEAAIYLKEQDPDTAIGEGWIRRRIKDGSLPVIKAETRQLINLDDLESFLVRSEPVQQIMTIKDNKNLCNIRQNSFMDKKYGRAL